MSSVSVSSKGQVVIPKEVRQRLGIKAGAKLELTEVAGEVRLRLPRPRKNAYEIMMESGFIGCGKGPADLSSNFKNYLAEDMLGDYEKTQRKARK